MARGARFTVAGATLHFPGVVALRAIDLAIAPGEAVALVGPSGAGKSSLLRLLCGWHQPSAGSVRVDDRELASLNRADLRAVRRSIGFVHQDLSLIPNLRAVHNVLAGRLGHLSLAGGLRHLLLPPRVALRRTHELLERVGIAEKMFVRTDHLSGGQQQRVAIARALYQEPRGLLADEPVASVDPARARDTLALLCGIGREHQLTLCVSLHSADLARELFPRLVGLREGQIVFDRAAADVDDATFAELYRVDPASGA